MLGRDAQDTQRIVRRWRPLAYRDPPRSVAVGRLEQVEHEALATLLAAQAGVRVPEVVTAASGPDGDALVVTRAARRRPARESRAGRVDDDDARGALGAGRAAARGRHLARQAQRQQRRWSLDDGPVLLDFSAATLGAPQSALDIDVAELLVACTVLVGPDRALDAALDGRRGRRRRRGAALPPTRRAHARTCATSREHTRWRSRISGQPAAAATGAEKPPSSRRCAGFGLKTSC